ncbi:MAG: hypothetical protein ACR2QT_11090 [Woeseiaceae bacterium]
MRPLAVVNGIVLGSCASIAVSLLAVMVVYIILGDEYPRVQDEFRPLLASTLIFLGMTVISAASFYSLLVNHKTAPYLQAILLAGLFATGWYYWP